MCSPITLPADIYDSKEVDILWDGVVYRISGADLKNHDFDSPDRLFFIREINGQVYFTTFDEHPSEIGITYTSEIVHQVSPMFVPNSVWVEEENIVVFDNFDPSNYDNIAIPKEYNVKFGDTVTLLVNGIQLMPEIRNNTEDGFLLVEGYLDDNTWAWVQSNYYGGTYYVRASGLLTVIVTRREIKTNCDLMIKATETPDSMEFTLVQGNYTTAKAKIELGLPVSCCMQLFNYDGNTMRKMTTIGEVGLVKNSEEEVLIAFSHYSGYAILPDNTVTV